MSVFDLYAPEVIDITDKARGQQYIFPFSFLENGSIEVYEILDVNGSEVRYLVPVTDYTLSPNTESRYPLSRGGVITFTRRHSKDAIKVSIERNTLIDQTIDFPNVRTFNPRQIEIGCDKATLIAQELVVRKCQANVGGLSITQEVTIPQYGNLPGSVLQFMFDKLTAILAAIDASAEDCRNEPERT